jgi:hypothetical protein
MLIGNLGSTRRAEVGSGGVLHLSGGTTIEWWVRTADKWHVPAVDVTVRDWMLDNSPVLKSALRIPGGDVTSSIYATVQGPREVICIELVNSTKAPVAAGLVVRSGSGRPIRVDGTTVFDGERPVAYLPSSPTDVIAGPLLPLIPDSDVNRVESNPAALGSESAVSEALFVVPLLHNSSIRFASLLGVSSALGVASTPVLSALPDPAMVARGWGLQAGEAARIDGDQPRANSLRALATSLLLFGDGAIDGEWTERAAVARGFIRIGAYDQALSCIDGIDDTQLRNGALFDEDDPVITAQLLAAVVVVGRHHPSPVFAAAMVPLVAGALEFLLRSSKRNPTVVLAHSGVLLGASRLLERVDEKRAARNARDAWESTGKNWPMARAMEPPLPAISSGAGFVPGDAARLSNAVVAAIDALAMEDVFGRIDLFAGWSMDDLVGRPVALHNVDTPIGKVSAAIRWHGARPALLWEVAAAPADQVQLACSVLDSSWVGTVLAGEALLAAPVR